VADHDQTPMPADGSGTRSDPPDENGELASRRGGAEQTGESGGGPYPHPYTGKDSDKHAGKDSGGDFKGGQSDQSYYGGAQLGEEELASNPNAPSTQP
jgi:hypothetical protein